MSGKSKHDILNRVNSNLMNVSTVSKTLQYSRALKKSRMKSFLKNDKEVLDMNLLEQAILLQVDRLQYDINFSHKWYERCNDLDTSNGIIKDEYLRKNSIDQNLFNKKFDDIRKKVSANLLILALLEQENFPLLEAADKLKQTKRGDVIDTFFELKKEISISTIEAIEITNDENFKFDYLSDVSNLLIKNYHDNYMKMNIYPNVTKYGVSDNEISHIVKAIAKTK